MTIGDLIQQLTNLMKENNNSAMMVKLGSTYNSTENTFDSFTVSKPMDSKCVYLVPTDVWIKSDLKRLAEREAQR